MNSRRAKPASVIAPASSLDVSPNGSGDGVRFVRASARMVVAISAGRLPKLALECAIEGRLRFVSYFAGDFGNASSRTFERPRCQLKPPPGQIPHGRLGKILGKPLQ